MKKLIQLTTLILLTLNQLTAQIELAQDYNPGSADAFSCFLCHKQATVTINGHILAVPTTAATGAELAELVNGKFVLLKDINPGPASGGISYLRQQDDLLYFIAKDTVSGTAVWVTDGTEAGTTLHYDPDPTSVDGRVTGMEFGSDGTLYVVFNEALYRYANGAGTQLATGIKLNTSNNNFPGATLVPHRTGVAYYSAKRGEFEDGGLYYADTTSVRLAFLPNFGSFDAVFGLQSVNDNLLFTVDASSTSSSRYGTFVFDTAADSLRRYESTDGAPLFIDRWYPLSDSLVVGKANLDEHYVLDGLNEPKLLLKRDRYTLAARESATSVRSGDTLFWQVGEQPTEFAYTDGTVSGTALFHDNFNTRTSSNLLKAGNSIYFMARNTFGDSLVFNRMDLATLEVRQIGGFHRREASVANFSAQLLAVANDSLYYVSNIRPEQGRELYRLATDLARPVSVFNRPAVAPLGVTVTPTSFTINADHPETAILTVMALDGRVISRAAAPVNTRIAIEPFRGMRLYLFEHRGKVAVRRITAR